MSEERKIYCARCGHRLFTHKIADYGYRDLPERIVIEPCKRCSVPKTLYKGYEQNQSNKESDGE